MEIAKSGRWCFMLLAVVGRVACRDYTSPGNSAHTSQGLRLSGDTWRLRVVPSSDNAIRATCFTMPEAQGRIGSEAR